MYPLPMPISSTAVDVAGVGEEEESLGAISSSIELFVVISSSDILVKFSQTNEGVVGYTTFRYSIDYEISPIGNNESDIYEIYFWRIILSYKRDCCILMVSDLFII
jgi:hypothetical protein